MAYAALVSLIRSLEQMLQNENLAYKEQITRIHEQASSFLALLEDSPWKFDIDLEVSLRDAAYQAEDMIESYLLSQIHATGWRREGRISSSFSSSLSGSLSSSFRPTTGWLTERSISGSFHATTGWRSEGRFSSFSSNPIIPTSSRSERRISSSSNPIIPTSNPSERRISSSSNPIIPTSSPSERRIRHMHHESRLQHQDLQELIRQFDSILVQVSMIKEDENVVDLRQKKIGSASSSEYETSNKITTLVEIQEDLLRIEERLTKSPSKLIIISIVGPGGIGKTTLAKKIYNDPLIVETFDFRAWVTVSQKYKVEEKLISLLGSIGNSSFRLREASIDVLQTKLFQILKGRKYLIVIDDIWDTRALDVFKRCFPDDNNGSRIILTTRLLGVATYAESGYIHRIKYLSLDGSWNLLLDKVFGQKHCPPELEEFGKKIVKNCKGLPLAIILIGGLLSNVDKSPEIWRYVAENISSTIAGVYYNFKEIFSLSYYNLPQHLKACFLYMGVFPGDQEIHVSHLINLWVAEGFIKPNGDKILEEVAKENLKDLIARSLVLVERLSSDGEIKTCSVHDLLIHLCITKAREENFLAVIRNNDVLHEKVIKNQRRLSIQCRRVEKFPKVATNSSVRSIVHLSESYSSDDLLSSAMNFGLLRVLDEPSVTLHKFPVDILDFINLRYLAFNLHDYCHLFLPISNLRNLQTVVVCEGIYPSLENILKLPLVAIWELPQLRHIVFQRCNLSFPYAAQIDDSNSVPLENLQTLANVYNFRFTERVFQLMPNLKKLVISYVYGSHTVWSPFYFSHFVHLLQLETLKCYLIAKSIHAPTQLLNFAFPDRLKNLTLSGCTLPWESLTVVGKLPNLGVLKLKDDAFVGSVWETNEGEFPQLKYFLVASSSLEHWRTEETHFPMLRHLSLKFCSELKEIPYEIGNIPTLQIIELVECSTSAVDSAYQIRNEQQSYGNDDLRVLIS